jgi:hypothetical protein
LENRKQTCAEISARRSARISSFPFLVSVFCFLAISSCAAPGDPTPPRPPIPTAVADLAAQQSGDSVVLTFTLPKETTDRDRLNEPPAIEIFRSFEPASAAPAAAKTPTYTIPSAVVDTYVSDGRVRFVDPIRPEELANHAGEEAVYVVRTRASKKKDSADSNVAALRMYPSPEPIQDVSARVTQSAIELAWTPPARTSSGAPLTGLASYRVYRAEVELGTEAAAAANPAQAKLKAPLELLGVTPSPDYRDAQFEFDHTYVYSIRSVAQYEAGSVESSDSRLLVLAPKDTFPPAPPQGLVAVVVPAAGQTPAHLEFSWAISPEPDVAGYNIYRSEPGGAAPQRLNRELLLTPAFRDMSAVPGRDYSYLVTAVDRAGNESQPSAAVSASLPAESERAIP